MCPTSINLRMTRSWIIGWSYTKLNQRFYAVLLNVAQLVGLIQSCTHVCLLMQHRGLDICRSRVEKASWKKLFNIWFVHLLTLVLYVILHSVPLLL